MTNQEKPKSKALRYLHDKFVGDDFEKKAILEEERSNAEVARLIYDLRSAAGLTQQQLGDRIGTTKSVISRLEDADYEGHSLSMLKRIADALDQQLTISFIPKGTQEDGRSVYF